VKRGFKAEAERIALREREAMGLGLVEALDPRQLAGHRQIRVVTLASFAAVIGEDVEHLLVTDSACFSAATVIRDERVMIVYNESHAQGRCANSIAHELSHVILGHPATNAFDAFGNRNFPKSLEDEATWLAGCLLVPKEAIISVLSLHDNDLERAAGHFGVSLQLLRWRMNATLPRRRR
jgi:Zn-dependent peptidase ImmA (M78 family)